MISILQSSDSRNQEDLVESGLRKNLEKKGLVYLIAFCAYLLDIWLHQPNGGGIYDDFSVFATRFCFVNGHCLLSLIPYVNLFVEYPPLIGFFMWSMGNLAKASPFFVSLGWGYYDYTVWFLAIPALLSVRELIRISDILHIGSKKRVLLYFVVSPTFIVLGLESWYLIGCFFTLYGIRKFHEGSRIFSGILFGLSAASNLLTAVPLLGLLIFGTDSWKERSRFLFGIVATILIIYGSIILASTLPHMYFNSNHQAIWFGYEFPNLTLLTDFYNYFETWGIEASWYLLFFHMYSETPFHVFPLLFITLSALIIYRGMKLRKTITTRLDRNRLTVTMSGLFLFAYLCTTSVSPPQMNLALLFAFVLLPWVFKRYFEFLVFDAINAFVIILGWSRPFGIHLPVVLPLINGSVWASPVAILEVIRSVWIMKFLLYDGLINTKTTRLRDIPTEYVIDVASRVRKPQGDHVSVD